MPIVACNQEVLDLFNHLLHDLYFEIPEAGFRVQDKQICIDLSDKDRCIHRHFAATYRLCVKEVVSLETHGDVEELPGNEAQLNEIKFSPKQKLVTFKCVHPFELVCEVKALRLSLDQLTTNETLAICDES